MNWDYIAGFFDGEGTVFKSHRNRNGRTEHIASVTMYNTHREVLEQIQNFLGGAGSIYVHLRPDRPNTKPCYAYRIAGHRTLQRILPKLISRSVLKRDGLKEVYSFVMTNRWKHNKLTWPQVAEVIGSVRAGVKRRDLADRFGVSLTVISNCMKSGGDALRP